jgi:hypothetical protein
MSAYVRWLAGRREGIEAAVRSRVAELRAEISEHSDISHRRTTDSIAQFYVGVEYFAQFAEEVGALDHAQAEEFKARCLKALLDVGSRQAEEQAAFDPAEMFVRLLGAAINAGQSHLCDENGGIPEGYNPESVGWRRPDAKENSSHQPRGSCIGWILGGELYLLPAAALKAAQAMAEDTGRIPLTSRALGVRLWERGYLASAERNRQKYTARRPIRNVRLDLFHLRRGLLVAKAQEAQPAPDEAVDMAAAGRAGPSGPVGPDADNTTQTSESEWGSV